MPRTPLRLALAAVVAVVLLASCGGGSGDDASDAPTTTAAGSSTTASEDTPSADPTGSTEVTTTEGTPTTAAPPADPKAICPSLKALGDFDAEANGVVATGNWSAIKAFYVDRTDEVLDIYDDAIAFDSEITADLQTLRGVSVSTREVAADASSFMDFSSGLLSMPGSTQSGAAVLSVNDFTEATCGFSLGPF